MPSLTVESVHQTINDVLEQVNKQPPSNNFSSWRLVTALGGGKIPYAFGIRGTSEGYLEAKCTCYLGYSTWDGRMLYVDHNIIIGSRDADIPENERAAYQLLAKIAVRLGCARLSWKVRWKEM